MSVVHDDIANHDVAARPQRGVRLEEQLPILLSRVHMGHGADPYHVGARRQGCVGPVVAADEGDTVAATGGFYVLAG